MTRNAMRKTVPGVGRRADHLCNRRASLRPVTTGTAPRSSVAPGQTRTLTPARSEIQIRRSGDRAKKPR
jgi:hypothetical protein